VLSVAESSNGLSRSGCLSHLGEKA
jgi:hypothetical protein